MFCANLLYIKKTYIILLALFVISSFVFIDPIVPNEKSEYSSSQLEKVTTEECDSIKIDYIDGNGRITVAAELGYSTVVISQTEQGELECYYDNQGKPVSRRYAGYYAILRKKDDKGNVDRVIYLDQDGAPVIIASGYAEERREINQKGQTIFIRYYDDHGQQVLTELYGYGEKHEYDEKGQIKKIIYIDINDRPMETKLGYAIVTRNYHIEKGKGSVIYEFYYDKDEKPIALSLGQYGVCKEYDENGRELVVTYLDENGISSNCQRGYASIKKTYHANGRTKSEQYFDQQGKPYALSEGQYGIEICNNKFIYLNQYGEQILNIKSLLYNNSWIIILCAISIVVLTTVINRKWNYAILVIYIIIIAYMTLIFREYVESKHVSILWGYKRILYDSEARSDIFKNIWLFVPIGAILYNIYPKRFVLLIPFILSATIEIVQHIFAIGICELDDIISNGLGAVIGFGGAQLTEVIIQRIKSWRYIHNI
ncbi:VanZ family protein [Clostridiales bacterium FE2010]|nr:VanZ family protein [Clostridiales bacterium FE2010]